MFTLKFLPMLSVRELGYRNHSASATLFAITSSIEAEGKILFGGESYRTMSCMAGNLRIFDAIGCVVD